MFGGIDTNQVSSYLYIAKQRLEHNKANDIFIL